MTTENFTSLNGTPYPRTVGGMRLDHSELCAWRFGMKAQCDCKLSEIEADDDE